MPEGLHTLLSCCAHQSKRDYHNMLDVTQDTHSTAAINSMHIPHLTPCPLKIQQRPLFTRSHLARKWKGYLSDVNFIRVAEELGYILFKAH